MPDAKELDDASVGAQETFGAREVFAESLDAARSARVAAIADAQASFDRTVSTLESATAALTADARMRIEEGPLADARVARDDALRAAERRFEREVNEAVEVYGVAAVTVFSAVAKRMTAVSTEYELYAAVIGAAEAALDSEEESFRAARAGGERAEEEYEVAEEALAEARRAYDIAAAEKNEAIGARPADPKPDYGSTILGGLAAGLSEAAGDRERAGAIRRELRGERSKALDEHAERVQRYESRLAEAEAALEAAEDVLGAATRRFNAASARYRSSSQASSSADTDYGAAYEARAVAGIDAARITRVHSVAELEAVTDSMREGALSAIAELEEGVLAGVTDATAVQVFESAIEAYAEPRSAAVEAALGEIETDYKNALASAEGRYNDAMGRASFVVGEFKRALLAYDTKHEGALRSADRRLEDALVGHYRKAPGNQHTGDFADVESSHGRALEAAATNRRQAMSRDVPAMRSTLAEVGARCYPVPEPGIYDNRYLDAQSMVSVVRNYKAERARVEAQFGDCVGRAYVRSAEASAKAAWEAAREEADAARASARSDVVARVLDADGGQAGRLRTLEAAISAGLLAASRRVALEFPEAGRNSAALSLAQTKGSYRAIREGSATLSEQRRRAGDICRGENTRWC